ncbi:TPA: hypothetical protein ACGR7B_003184 [Enterobacter hormaechei]
MMARNLTNTSCVIVMAGCIGEEAPGYSSASSFGKQQLAWARHRKYIR